MPLLPEEKPQHGIITVTSDLMRILSREELEGVLAHELAHIKHRDILVGTVAAAIAGAVKTTWHGCTQMAMIWSGRGETGRRRARRKPGRCTGA